MNDGEIFAHAICNSLLLDHHGLGEKEVYWHADNFIGQNKNSCIYTPVPLLAVHDQTAHKGDDLVPSSTPLQVLT